MHRSGWWAATGVGWTLLLLGCEGADPLPCTGRRCFSQEVRILSEVPSAPAIDLVVVLDDSPSLAARNARMLEKLRRAFEVSFGALRDRFGGVLGDFDLEIRVISSTARVGDGGLPGCAAAPAADCALPAEGLVRWNRFCGGPGPNVDGTLPSAIACAARFPSTGCAIEQPLAALADNLARGPALRPDAILFVLIVSDEDDCSFEGAPPFPVDPAAAATDAPALSRSCAEAERTGALTPVSRYHELLRRLKRSERDVHLSVLSGPVDASEAPVPDPGGLCADPAEPVQAAPRLGQLVRAFEGRGSHFSFCADDWSQALDPFAQRFAIAYDPPCITRPLLDLRPDEPGLQADCNLDEQVGPTGPRRVLPACTSSGPPCWSLAPSLACQAGYVLQVVREGCVPPRGTVLELRCAGEPMGMAAGGGGEGRGRGGR